MFGRGRVDVKMRQKRLIQLERLVNETSADCGPLNTDCIFTGRNNLEYDFSIEHKGGNKIKE